MSLNAVNATLGSNNAEDGRQFTIHFKNLVGLPSSGIVLKSKAVDVTIEWVACINRILELNALHTKSNGINDTQTAEISPERITNTPPLIITSLDNATVSTPEV